MIKDRYNDPQFLAGRQPDNYILEGEFIPKGSEIEILEEDRLQEMATLLSKRSDLPVNLYIDDSKSYIRGGHSKRIKFQVNKDDTDTHSFSSMTLDGNVVENTFPQKHDIKTKDIKLISTFVRNNVYALDVIADMKIDFQDFLQVMIKNQNEATEEEKKKQREEIDKIINSK